MRPFAPPDLSNVLGIRSENEDPVNLGNPTEWTIRDLVATIETLLGRPLPVVAHPLPTDDPQVRQPDITRARTLLGWSPPWPWRRGSGRRWRTSGAGRAHEISISTEPDATAARGMPLAAAVFA